jgi:hypothetical protein
VIPGLYLDKNGYYSISMIELNNSDFKGEPSYNIEVQTSNSRVNLGDNYSMKIFISGVGDAIFGKMRANIPDYIVKDNYVVLRSLSYNYTFDRLNDKYIIHNPYRENSSYKSRFDMVVPSFYFNLQNITSFVNFGELNTIEGDAPFTIDFAISPNAPGGDHDIYLTIFYKLGAKWYTSSQIVPIHINKWYENDYMQWFIFISLGLAIFSQIISGVYKFYGYIKYILEGS